MQVIPVLSDPFGGPVTVVKNISRELAKKHEVIVYTTTAFDSKHDHGVCREELIDGYSVIYFNKNLKLLSHTGFLGQLGISSSMFHAIKRNLSYFDVVHVHSWRQFPDLVTDHFAVKYGVPYVLQAHGSIPKIGKRFRKEIFDTLFGRKMINHSAGFIALSDFEVEQYKRFGIPPDKINVVPNGIYWPDNFINVNGYFKRKLGLSDSTKIILYLGRIHETKCIDLLVRAYSIVAKKAVGSFKTVLVIVGPDDGYLAHIKSLVLSLGLADSVYILGFINSLEKAAAFADADVFVTPRFYGSPVTFLESCASGTPIITTTMGDTLDWIDGNVGYVTPPSEQALAVALFTILSDPELRAKLSINCRKMANGTFSIQTVVKKLETVYESVV